MADLLQRISELKTQAKNRRDLKRYDRAVGLLKQAIDMARAEFETTGVAEWRATLASELSDCFGILGGVERRWALDPSSAPTLRAEHLRLSVEAYDKGHGYESDPALGSSTYNRLNRLVSRLLLNPALMTPGRQAAEQEAGRPLDVRADLEAIASEIEKHGSDSVWAAADLALINVLLGRQDATSAYATFENKEPPDFACQSALDGVSALAAVDLPSAAELKKAEQRLTALRDRLHTR